MTVPLHIVERVRKKAFESCNNISKVGAVGLNSNGDIVHTAFNRKRFARKGGGLHAEEQIFRVAKRKGIKTIIIARVGGNGFLPIDPCEKCSKIAKKLDIKIISIIGEVSGRVIVKRCVL